MILDSVVEEAPSSSKGSGGEGEAGVLQYPGSLFHVHAGLHACMACQMFARIRAYDRGRKALLRSCSFRPSPR